MTLITAIGKSCNKDDNSLNTFILNAYTIFNDVPNSFEEIKNRSDILGGSH